MHTPSDPKQVFLDVRELPAAEHAAFLDAACSGDAALRQRVEALLAADERAGTFLASPTQGAGDGGAPQEQPSSVIGRFKLLQEIGEGGFGTVWMAEQQQPVRRQVALKVIKRGMDTRSVVARFEQERQALALMDHPNIAKVFDGGETPAGRPYFAMELVSGLPVTQFCDQQSLDAKGRLALFVLVCHAVQHAHQKGIIHRDLKPSNVLVTSQDGVPVPKVIDFGVAKAVHRPFRETTVLTELQQMVGTPEYMAPEQAELSGIDIDTRADIYSLGVLLYELLTGTLPFDLRTREQKGLLELLRVIREDEPQKPSTRVSTAGESSTEVARRRRTDPRRLGRLLRGDLDWIVMKALEKDRARRYVSADAFAADVERHLRDEPVEAGPPGRVYRLQKYVRRHRIGVIAGGVVSTALVVGLSAAIWGVVQANEQRDRAGKAERDAVDQAGIATAAKEEAVAEQRKTAAMLVRAEAGEATATKEAARANTVVDLVERLLTSANPREVKGADYKVRQLLDDFDRELGTTLATQPEVEGAVRRLIGKAYRALGLYRKAEPHLTRTLELREQAFGGDHERVAESLRDLSLLQCDRGQLTVAEELARQSLAMSQRLHVSEHEAIADGLQLLAYVLTDQGRLGEAEELEQRALAMRRTLFKAPHAAIASNLNGLAGVYMRQGRLVEAERLFGQCLEMIRELRGGEHVEVAEGLDNLASVVRLLGKYEEAEELNDKALAMHRRILGNEHPNIATCLNNRSVLLWDLGRAAESEECSRQALAMARKLLGDEHPAVAVAWGNLALSLTSQDKLAEAEAAHREALRIERAVLGPEHPNTATSLNNLAGFLGEHGKAAEAEDLQREALAMLRKLLGNDNHIVASCLFNLGDLLRIRGRFVEAKEVHQQALAMRRRAFPEEHPKVANSLTMLAKVLLDERKFSEAEELLRRALEIRRKVLGDENQQVSESLQNLARALLFQAKYAEAEVLFRKALAMTRKLLGDDHHEVATCLCNLAGVLRDRGRLAEAEQAMRESSAIGLKTLGQHDKQVAERLNNLGLVLHNQGKSSEAEEMFRRSLAIEEARGKASQVATILSNLVMALVQQDKFAEAEQAGQRALAIRRELGIELDVANSLHNLVALQLRTGKLAEAEASAREAVRICRNQLAPGHPTIATCLGGLAAVMLVQGKNEHATEPLEEALAIQQNALGDSHPDTATTLGVLSDVLRSQGKLAALGVIQTKVLERARSRVPPDELQLAGALAQLGRTLLEQGGHAEAEPLLRECLDLRTAKLPGDWLTWNAMSLLGAALAGQGRHAEAEPLLREGYEKLDPPPAAAQRKREALERLIQHYEAWGKADEAATWRKLLGDAKADSRPGSRPASSR